METNTFFKYYMCLLWCTPKKLDREIFKKLMPENEALELFCIILNAQPNTGINQIYRMIVSQAGRKWRKIQNDANEARKIGLRAVVPGPDYKPYENCTNNCYYSVIPKDHNYYHPGHSALGINALNVYRIGCSLKGHKKKLKMIDPHNGMHYPECMYNKNRNRYW